MEFIIDDMRFELVNNRMTINVYIIGMCFLDIINFDKPLDNIGFWSRCCEYEYIERNGSNL